MLPRWPEKIGWWKNQVDSCCSLLSYALFCVVSYAVGDHIPYCFPVTSLQHPSNTYQQSTSSHVASNGIRHDTPWIFWIAYHFRSKNQGIHRNPTYLPPKCWVPDGIQHIPRFTYRVRVGLVSTVALSWPSASRCQYSHNLSEGSEWFMDKSR